MLAQRGSSGHGTLIYAMKVTEVLSLKKYSQQYKERDDAMPVHDKPWRKALISDQYYYFGRHAVELKQSHYSTLKVARGFRDKFTAEFIQEFVNWLEKHKRPKTIEPCAPQDAPRKKCHANDLPRKCRGK